jgi:predicted DNA-binding protein (MmcQ/YjbR family)
MPKKSLKSLEGELLAFALTYPEAAEDHPWGHIAVKVRGKIFLILGGESETAELKLSVKLPSSRDMAVDLPFAEPTGYGLGKSGWVTAHFTRTTGIPMKLLRAWIDESYRAVAPKRLVKTLGGEA